MPRISQKGLAPAVGVSIKNTLLKVAIFGPDKGTAQNLPKIAGLHKNNLLGRTGAHFWTSRSKLDKTVPAIIAQFSHEFRIFQSCRFPWQPFDPRIWGSAIFEFNWNIFKCFLIIQKNRKVWEISKRLRVVEVLQCFICFSSHLKLCQHFQMVKVFRSFRIQQKTASGFGHCTILYYTILYYTILDCTTQYYTLQKVWRFERF